MSITKPLYNATANGNVEFIEAEYEEYEASLPQVEVSYQEHLKQTVRAERNAKLVSSDWTQVADAPVSKEDWAVYRQELRDITIQESFPNDVTWPTEPLAEVVSE